MLRKSSDKKLKTRRMTEQWFYKTDGQTHGPFSNNDMLQWFQQGYLASDLPLSQSYQGEYYPLEDWFPGRGNSFQAGAMANPARGRENNDEERWYFLDMQGEVQGPFSNNQMLSWHQDGFFETDLQIYDTIRNPEQWGWKSLNEYFPTPGTAFGAQDQGAPQAAGFNQGQDNAAPARFQFPTWLPSPPAYKGVPKVYPSERNEAY